MEAKQCTQEPSYFSEFSQAAMQAEGQSGDSKDHVRVLEGHQDIGVVTATYGRELSVGNGHIAVKI